jgi:hypothetical protein
VIKTLEEIGPTKLLDSEQDRVRCAADNLIFSAGLSNDVAANEALGDVERLCHALVESGRWEEVAARQLYDDVCQCGPEPATQLKAA